MSIVFDLPLFWLYLGQRHYWRNISYTSAFKRYLGLRVGRLFIGFVWISRESVPVCLPSPLRPEALDTSSALSGALRSREDSE